MKTTNEKRNRARAATLRKKHEKSINEKFHELFTKPAIELAKEKFGLEVEEIIDLDTGEYLNKEDFINMFKGMKPKTNQNERKSEKETGRGKKELSKTKWWQD